MSSPLIPYLICVTRGGKKIIFVKKLKVKALQLQRLSEIQAYDDSWIGKNFFGQINRDLKKWLYEIGHIELWREDM